MKKLIGILLLLTTPAAAEELRYDNDDGRYVVQGLVAGGAEAMRLTPLHPATVESVRMKFTKSGEVEVHIWQEIGAHQPLITEDLITPIHLQVPTDGWLEITLPEPIEVCAECHFHVGHVLRADDGPTLLLDSSEDIDSRASAYLYSADLDMMVWSPISNGDTFVHYLVRATVAYHDQITEKRFVDISEETGYGSTKSVAVVDYDLDGDVDVLQESKLLRNDDGVFTDVSEDAGLAGYTGVTGGIFADYDRDGDLDLFLMVNSCCNEQEAGGVHDHLLRNDNGIFTDVSDAAGTYDYWPNRSAAWGDYNGDGYADIILGGYIRPGTVADPTGITLFRNNTDGTFADFTNAARIDFVPAKTFRTLNWADYDRDGWLDLYIGSYKLQINYMFHNLGGFFEEVGEATKTEGIRQSAYYGHTIGAEWGDVDNDGDLDLVVMNFAHPRFLAFSDLPKIYLNPLGTGSVEFVDVWPECGMLYAETAYEPALGDFDNDGDLDVFQTNTYAGRESYFFQSRLMDDGQLRFSEISYPSGARVYQSQGVVWADFDNDGDLDLFSKGLFRNDGPVGNWLKVRLMGGDGQDTFGIGATVTVTAGDMKITRLVSAGKGEGSQKPFELHFGLGDNEVYDTITVNWLGGYVDQHPCGQANQRLVLTQGEILAPDCQEEEPDAGVADGGDDGGIDAGDVAGDLGGGTGGGGCGCGGTAGAPWLALGLLWLLRRR
jgi:uncharacterized protein (TIGR03382 family)